MPRRKFLKLSATTVGAVGALDTTSAIESAKTRDERGARSKSRRPNRPGEHVYNGDYTGEYLNQVGFPLGGIGAGMICLEGSGALSSVSSATVRRYSTSRVSSPPSRSKENPARREFWRAQFPHERFLEPGAPATARAAPPTAFPALPVRPSNHIFRFVRSPWLTKEFP